MKLEMQAEMQAENQAIAEDQRSSRDIGYAELATGFLQLIRHPFRGIRADIRRRLPYYRSDIKDGLSHSRIIPGTLQIYFMNLIPAMAYTLDMYRHTDGQYGVNEVLLGSAIAAGVFGAFSCQPLTIVGITGLIDLYTYTTYNIITKRYGQDFLQFMAWTSIWAGAMHFIIAAFNLVYYAIAITQFSVDTFGFYVGVIYIQYAVRTLVYELQDVSKENFYFSVAVAVLFFAVAQALHLFSQSRYLVPKVRILTADYVLAICVLFFTGFTYIPGPLKESGLDRLPITKAFSPTADRSWLVQFWKLDLKYIFVALPFGALLTLLFYFDHNVSSLAAQSIEFPLRKPAGFHWDFFLLGITTIVAGILGIPPPNGLVPQAPLHTHGLLVRREAQEAKYNRKFKKQRPPPPDTFQDYVVEQRVSNLVQGLMILGTMTRPFLVVLGLIRRAVLSGVFAFVGWGAIENNGITLKLLYLFRQKEFTSKRHILGTIRNRRIWLFLFIQFIDLAMTIAISQTIAAIGFAVLITALIPFRTIVMPRIFTSQELDALDKPAASEFTRQSFRIPRNKKR